MVDYQHLIGVRYEQTVVLLDRQTITCEVRAIVDGDQAVMRAWSRKRGRYVYAVMPAAFLEENLQDGTYKRKSR